MKLLVLITAALFVLCPLPRATGQSRDDTKRGDEKRQVPSEPAARPAHPQPSRDDTYRTPADPQKQGARTTPIPDARPQPSGFRQEQPDAAARPDIRSVFRIVEEGMTQGSAGRISPHFASHVTLNLRGGETGSFSANQAYYVLERFFSAHQVTGIDFNSMSETGPAPYAAGTVGLQGESEGLRVYVALARAGNRWVITQMNIY